MVLKLSTKIFLSAVAAIFIVVPVAAHADERTAQNDSRTSNRTSVCESRTQAITALVTRAGAQGSKHLELFSKAFTRIDNFYNDKKLSSPNYDSAKEKVKSAQAAAKNAVDLVKLGFSIDCKSDNLGSQVKEFIAKIRTMNAALKDYRVALKDFLMVVKNATNQREGAK